MNKLARKKDDIGTVLYLIVAFIFIIYIVPYIKAIMICLLIFVSLFVVGIIVKIFIEIKKYRDFLKLGIYEKLNVIDSLSGHEFERYVSILLKSDGFYNVLQTRGSKDYGADIIAEKNNIKYAFQCKRLSSSVGPKTIGEVLRGMHKYNCKKGVIITNNYFTKQAIEEGWISNIELWDRDKLIELLS